MYLGKYVSAEGGGGSVLDANGTSAPGWKTFKLWRIDEKTFNFRVFRNQFVGVQSKGDGRRVIAEATTPGEMETFQIIRNANDSSRVRIRATNGLFLQAKTQDLVTADYAGDGGWEDNNPSVFVMMILRTRQGEYQITNGYGPDKAPQVMKEHWKTFTVEDDFKFISENGINTVRIPVGWWTTKDPTPPKPFVGGSLIALDNAFVWAQKYGIKVIVDLHAAPGAQNGYDHTGSRDGSVEWGKSNKTVQQSVEAIEFLTARYAQNTQLYAVELMNEPQSPEIALDTLIKYYKAGYEAVRRHSSSAFVVMSNRIGDDINQRELFPLASSLQLTVIDVHYYNLHSDVFSNMTAKQNIDYINHNRTSDLKYITTSARPLTFVGEWAAVWEASESTEDDLPNYVNAQLKVYGRTSFGWAYWTLKNEEKYWSLQWMIQNGYINLTHHI
ncbi:hypothetical protein RND81_03G079300 [Saponaria officinalis]|uniref:Mannan endo-1,4-beta-mannosidase n=1 Tax=Saponaria officinalis TaxID=3572 RepID=A0AAW1M8Q6_SAPOF